MSTRSIQTILRGPIPRCICNVNKLTITAAILLLLSACMSSPKGTAPLSQGSLQAQQAMSKAHWRCDGDTDKRWHCRDESNPISKVFSSDELTQPPVELIATTAAPIIPSEPAEVAPKSVDTVDPQSMAVTAVNLDEVPDNHFAVQLIAAKNRQGIATYRQSHPDQQTIELQTVVNQDPWYILLLGIYPSQEAAKSAIKAMSPAPSADPWIRSVGPLKQSIASGQ